MPLENLLPDGGCPVARAQAKSFLTAGLLPARRCDLLADFLVNPGHGDKDRRLEGGEGSRAADRSFRNRQWSRP